MDIVIVSQYLRNIENLNGNNSRFIYLARMLSKNAENQIEIITSSFLHGEKRQVRIVEQPKEFKITPINEPGYPKNVCLKRFYSHATLAKNVKEYLQDRKTPDCIYSAVPSLDVAKVVAEYCNKNNVRFLIDIQDLWPEAFKMVFNIPVLSDLIFKPMEYVANKIYAQADEIIAVSKTYCERALHVNKKCKTTHTIFLGTKLEEFDSNVTNFNIKEITVNLPEKKQDDLWLAYCGTLGSSYDLISVFDALDLIKKKGSKQTTFIVMGDGPRREEFEQYAAQKNIDVVFTGSLPYAQMCGLLCMCDITVNPIIRGSAATVINKHGDYAAAGLPVLNTQESKEYRSLVEEYDMGFNCENNDAVDLAKKITILIENVGMRDQLGKNARRCAEEKFDRKNTYNDILNIIMKK